MTFGEKLKAARIESGLKQTELAKKLNTTGNTISNWENNVSKPDLDTLSYICGILHVKASYFLHATLPEDEVSIPELNMIKSYRALDQHGKETVSYILNRETERVKQIEQANATVVEVTDSDSHGRVLQYFHSVSAGTGEVIFDDVYTERITVPDRPQYRRVAYAVKVSGHSMEPLYHDKDILLVEPTCEISVGEIGIFNVNGQAYVKKLGKGKLISLNKGYDDVPLTEESLCMGRVVDSLKS